MDLRVMTNYTDKKYIEPWTDTGKSEQGGECPSKPSEKACGSCQGCSGQRKKSSTIYYVIPALVIVVIALLLKYFSII